MALNGNPEKPLPEAENGGPTVRHGSLRALFYIIVLAISLSILNLIFGWASIENIPEFLQPIGNLILLVNPLLPYVQAALILGLGYLIINNLSNVVYAYIRKTSDHPTAATIRTIARISGYAVILSNIASVFNLSAAAALTVGSFGGLVVGFATQTILNHVVAGVFLLISRPYTFGDIITVAGQTGVVKEVKIMHLVLESMDGATEILIPTGTVVTQIIQKKKPPKQLKPIKTVLELEKPSEKVNVGATITFTGRLLELESGKPVPNALIKLMESDIGGDDLLGSGITDSEGRFSIAWIARKMDPHDKTAEIYAKFEGNEDYQPSRGKVFVLKIERDEA